MNEDFMSLQEWMEAGCQAGIWSTIIREDDASQLDENTGNLLANACLLAIRHYGNNRAFECRSPLDIFNQFYHFSFEGHPFAAILNGDKVQIATTFRILE